VSLEFGWTGSHKITERSQRFLHVLARALDLVHHASTRTPGLDRRMILNVWVRRGRGEAVSRVRGTVNQSSPFVIECEEPEERPWV